MTSRTILLLSGPNLDRLGSREPEIYGAETLDDHVQVARAVAESNGLALEHVQSAAEADLVTAVHDATRRCDAIVINPGALTHYGWSLHDALAAYDGIVVEVHLSNPSRREAWRQTSVVAPVASASISGCGGLGYSMAIDFIAARLGE